MSDLAASVPPAAWTARCWCAPGTRLEPFAHGYARCLDCETVVCTVPPLASGDGVVDDASDFYGERYWSSHQTQTCGFPHIEDRARADLPERCLYWLAELLRYRVPPGRLLELGAAHGGFVRLAALAGFESVGVEMSPAVVAESRRRFGVEMRIGPLESAELGRRAFDVVASFDVLEHLRDPEATLRHVRSILAPDGVLIVQTPDFPAAAADRLRAADDRFLEQLKPPEHLFLFSKRSVTELLRRTGFPHVAFGQPLFSYDMFFVAGAAPLAEIGREDTARALLASPESRIALALLDLAGDRDRYQRVAAERLQVIDALNAACEERLAVIERLDRELRGRA